VAAQNSLARDPVTVDFDRPLDVTCTLIRIRCHRLASLWAMPLLHKFSPGLVV
jgi:hypothetical protein